MKNFLVTWIIVISRLGLLPSMQDVDGISMPQHSLLKHPWLIKAWGERPLWWTQGFFDARLARLCTHFPNSRWALPRCHLALQAPKATFDTHFKLQTVKCVSKKPLYLLSQSWIHGYRPSTAARNCNFSGVGGGAGALQAKGDTNDVAGLLAGGLSGAINSLFLGDGHCHPTFSRNPYNWYTNPYYWVDDHPLWK